MMSPGNRGARLTAMVNAERRRLDDADNRGVPWRRWGPYLSERQWGTVREDYSSSGDAWSSFTHEQARSRAYRWGEDGLAGISDDRQLLCLALGLWNGRDPLLKERLFGLTNTEGNHGEDVKECYFYLDATPTSSYLKMLYKYPQAEFPYADLVATNQVRGKTDPEYELLDTGVFNDSRYFDVFVEYAKAAPEDLLMQVSVHNRGPDEAELHVLPTLWFRHTWSWAGGAAVPSLRAVTDLAGLSAVRTDHGELGSRWCYAEGAVPVLVTGNETNNERVFGTANETPYVKDGIDRAVVHGEAEAVDPGGVGTKAALHHVLTVPAGGSATLRMRLTPSGPDSAGQPFADFDEVMGTRRGEADDFWADVLAGDLSDDERLVSRQALAGMLWSKQFYAFDVERWLTEHGADPLGGGLWLRNHDWRHLRSEDVISMPDTWEYPWFAAWDLAFHTVALSVVDIGFAKQQLALLLDRRYLHPNGQLPAYEWNFSDVNPPVHAWATLFIYELEKTWTGTGDRAFLEEAFHKLLRNFGWWLNRKDADDRNIFQGGFLGLDNIGVFDRSAPLPTGGWLDQADGTAWMALYCQTMTMTALELARGNPVYLEQAQALLENFAWIAAATNHVGPDGVSLWDEQDGFFYDVLRSPDGSSIPLKVRSIVGLMPLAAATVVDSSVRTEFPQLVADTAEFLDRHPAVKAALWGQGRQTEERGPALFSLFDEERMRRILARMLDEDEFLGPYGIRSLSRWHADHPYLVKLGGQEHEVGYRPAESDTGMFGGNSNWRGPVWFPINLMLVRALLNLHAYFGDGYRVEYPTGSGRQVNLYEVAREISDRLVGTFREDAEGHRPVHGGQPLLQSDPYWRDLVLFYEYFHGDNGAGIGASHQTGWTGIAGVLPLLFRGRNAQRLRERSTRAAMTGWPAQPVIYEVNTAVWLDELSRAAGRRLTLADVAPSDWDAVTPAGVDAVWLMGVWERSPAGLTVARANADLQASFREALPDLRDQDVIGSPYCVRRYVVDTAFGGPEALAQARAALAERGVRLLLDYVPNHVAPDHPWVTGNPELFVHGGADDLRTDPAGWLSADGQVLARGRDPYFPPWPDVVQLNAFAPALRTATADTLAGIADQCDGIRCDMAMLVTNEVFARTWGDRAGPAPAEEFWPSVIRDLRARHPETVLVAEAYWDLEWELQRQGFDFCYDKRLYDRLVSGDASAVREHLRADLGYQSQLLRFLENHDEPRIAARVPEAAERAAAVAIATLPGATLWQEGQFEGRRVRPPVFLARRPDEPPDGELAEWYQRLLGTVAQHRVRAGTWRLIEVRGWPDNQSSQNLLAWCWSGDSGGDRHLVVVNLSGQPAQGRIPLDWPSRTGRGVRLTDLLHGSVLERDGAELIDLGLYVALAPWQSHVFALS
jgi:hypothetical protein